MSDLRLQERLRRQQQQKVELEVETLLQDSIRQARQRKDVGQLQRAIARALRTKEIPRTFPALVTATEELLDMQNEARFRLKMHLRKMDIGTVKKNGKIDATVASIREAVAAAERRDAYGREVEQAQEMIDELLNHRKLQDAAVQKLGFALKATRTIGLKRGGAVERLQTFVAAAKKVGIGVWNATYVEALKVVDPAYLQSIGIATTA